MATVKISEDRLLEKITDVFRTYGYEGATLSLISKATGLERASLYHRYPGGKADMARAVLDRIGRHFAEHVLAPLSEPRPPAERMRRMAARLAEFYDGGGRSCALDTLSLGDPRDPWRRQIEQSVSAWRDAMCAVAKEAGLPPGQARRRAEDALVRIQGALVLARAGGDRSPFQRVLKELPAQLTAKEAW